MGSAFFRLWSIFRFLLFFGHEPLSHDKKISLCTGNGEVQLRHVTKYQFILSDTNMTQRSKTRRLNLRSTIRLGFQMYRSKRLKTRDEIRHIWVSLGKTGHPYFLIWGPLQQEKNNVIHSLKHLSVLQNHSHASLQWVFFLIIFTLCQTQGLALKQAASSSSTAPLSC